MYERKTFIIGIIFILLALSIAIIVTYFIVYKSIENSLEITRFLPHDTPVFLGLDNIAAQLKKLEYTQTKAEFKKSGFYDNLEKIIQKVDVKIHQKTGFQLREWAQYIEKDAAIGIDSVNNKLVFIFAARIRKDKENYKETFIKFVFPGQPASAMNKSYEGISYGISSGGYIVAFYRNILFISNDEEYFKNVCEVIAKKQENLAHNRSFLKIQEKLEYVGGVLGFIDVRFIIRKPQAFHQLIRGIDSLVNVGILRYAGYYNSVFGWENLDMIGMSSYIEGEEIIQKTFLLLSDTKKGGLLANVLHLKSAKLDIDKTISNEFSDFIIASIGDASKLYDAIENSIMNTSSKQNQFKFLIMTALVRGYGIDVKGDFITTLGDQVAVVFPLKELYKLGNGIPENIELMIIAKINDQAKMTLFLNRVKSVFLKHSIAVHEELFEKNIIYRVQVREQSDVKILYGKNKGYFFISSDGNMIKKAIEAANGKDSITKDKAYANCKSKFGPRSNYIFVSRDMLGKRLLARREFSDIEDIQLKESIELTINNIQSTMWQACGQMSSGANTEDGLIIQTYYPLSYMYMIFIGAVSGLMLNL